MIYNLLIIEKDSGINLANIKFSGNAYEEQEADHISASVTAIADYFRHLDFGDLETFNFLEKSIVIHRKQNLLLLLICEKNTNSTILTSKLELISNMIVNSPQWFATGDLGRFSPLYKPIQEVFEDLC